MRSASGLGRVAASCAAALRAGGAGRRRSGFPGLAGDRCLRGHAPSLHDGAEPCARSPRPARGAAQHARLGDVHHGLHAAAAALDARRRAHHSCRRLGHGLGSHPCRHSFSVRCRGGRAAGCGHCRGAVCDAGDCAEARAPGCSSPGAAVARPGRRQGRAMPGDGVRARCRVGRIEYTWHGRAGHAGRRRAGRERHGALVPGRGALPADGSHGLSRAWTARPSASCFLPLQRARPIGTWRISAPPACSTRPFRGCLPVRPSSRSLRPPPDGWPGAHGRPAARCAPGANGARKPPPR